MINHVNKLKSPIIILSSIVFPNNTYKPLIMSNRFCQSEVLLIILGIWGRFFENLHVNVWFDSTKSSKDKVLGFETKR
jgi:hypothetical protein